MWQVYSLIGGAVLSIIGVALSGAGGRVGDVGSVFLWSGLLFILGTTAVLIKQSIVVIGGEQVGLVERLYFGRGLPQGRVVALDGEVGIQATTLGPGLHFLLRLLYKVDIEAMVVIGEHEVGIVESIDGVPLKAGEVFARRVEGHDHYQDGAAFLTNGGQKGPQVDVLPPGKYRINPYLFRLKTVPIVVVPQGNVGVVNARDGEPLGSGRLLARKVPHHSGFQDGAQFLGNGGQRGPQIDVILPGSYRINSDLFNVGVQPAIT